MNKGILYGIGAYVLWGFFPIYWKAIQVVPAHEIVCHRMAWSFLFLFIILVYRKRWRLLLHKLKNSATVLTFVMTAGVLCGNWFIFIWAVNSGYIVEASLGYFINPLVYVLFGVVFLRESPRFWQWVAIGILAGGVLFLTFGYGSFPWIALTLAFSFGLYGFFRKTAALDSLEGLSFETSILFVPALIYLLHLECKGVGAFGHSGLSLNTLLAFTGVVTSLPLLLFASAARRISLTNLGVLQYISPTLQLLLGVMVYGEDLTRARAIGFGIIWVSLAIYSIDSVKARRRVLLARQPLG